MNILDIFKRKKSIPVEVKEQRSDINYYPVSLTYSSYSNYQRSTALQLSSVYRCVQVISDSVASLPFQPYLVDENDGYKQKYVSHNSYHLLNVEPNQFMSRFTFMKLMVTNMLLDGNAYAEIVRDSRGNAISITPLNPYNVQPVVIDGKLKYKVLHRDALVDVSNMIHLLHYTEDGLMGVSVLTHAITSLQVASDSESHAAGFFRGGANVAGILTVNGVLNADKAQKIKDAWKGAFTPVTGEPNGVAVLEGNMDFKPVSVNPRDAQMLESRQYNVVDICRFFGVSPTIAFDLTKGTYANVEQLQLEFLTSTLTPLLEKIELEFNRKLYRPSERSKIEIDFDTSVLLRADSEAKSNYYMRMFQIGAYTVNEIRRELGLKPIDEGDKAYVQVNMQPVSQSINKDEEEKQII